MKNKIILQNKSYNTEKAEKKIEKLNIIETSGICSPSRAHLFKKNNGCLNLSELRALVWVYNKIVQEYHSSKNKTNNTNNENNENKSPKKDNVYMRKIPLNSCKSFQSLYNALNKRFSPSCGENNEVCWVEHPLIKSKKESISQFLIKKYRPIMNKDWFDNNDILLDTFDILHVLEQYNETFNDFKYLGTYPLDLMSKKGNNQCIVGKICHFDLVDLFLQQKKHVAIVFNFDPHNKPGSHWVAFYANFDPHDIRFGFYYYDSYGGKEPKEIRDCFKYFEEQFNTIYKKIKK